MTSEKIRGKMLKLGFALFLLTMLLGMGSVSASAKKVSTWVTKSSGKTYYYNEDGKKLKNGKYQIGSKYYYFDEKGVQRTGWQEIGSKYYYFRIAAGEKGYMRHSTSKKTVKVNGITLKANGKAKMTSYAKKKLPILVAANKTVQSVTKLSDSKPKKLRKCYDLLTSRKWIRPSDYLGKFHKGEKYWDIYYAKKIFVDGKRKGDCYSYGVVFAYLANAIGYKNVYAISSGDHGWTRIGNYYYDPDWYFCNGGHAVFKEAKHKPEWGQNYVLYEKYVIKI